jgi:predicted metal-binding membrane protein
MSWAAGPGAAGDTRPTLFLPLMAALIALAWLTLILWAQSPYGRYLDHGNWLQIGLAASLCRALPDGGVLLPALLYAGGWLLMSAAMMLPTALPLFAIFQRLVADRRDRLSLSLLLVLGYLLVWGGFGVAAHLLDAALNAAALATPWLALNGWLLGAIVLALAGAFQFSPLKYHCLDKCRTPLSFVIEHWRGRRTRSHALLLGMHHGLFCLGCCWAIMLLMFVVGTGNVGWMLALGAIMAIEKNVGWGRRLSAPLGLGLLGSAAAVIAANL